MLKAAPHISNGSHSGNTLKDFVDEGVEDGHCFVQDTVTDNQSLLILLWTNGSWKLSNFVGSTSALEKESIAHFLAFVANCLGVGQIFGSQKM